MINILGFLASRAIAEAEGLPRDRANQLALVGAIMGLTPISLIIVQAVSRREIPPRTEAPTTAVRTVRG